MEGRLARELEVEVLDVTRIDRDRTQVLMKEKEGLGRICCLYTDAWTGLAIYQSLKGLQTKHMHSQALMRRLLLESRVKLTKVLLFHEVGSNVLEARMFFNQENREFFVDCRATDGAAQALRWKLPILMDEPSLQRANVQASLPTPGVGNA